MWLGGTSLRMTTLPTTSEIPESLLEYDQWVCWREQERGEKQTKVPVNPHNGRFASTTDSETWGDFEAAREYAASRSADGLGFVFCDDDPFVGVDLDDARTPETETPTDWAADIIATLDSYTEVSPSGTGYHVLVEGELPPGRNRRGDVELYETARFFTVTGDYVDSTPAEVFQRTDALIRVYADHVVETNEGFENDEQSASSDDGCDRTGDEVESDGEDAASPSASLSDEELLSKARAASNSAKFERLWRGDIQGYDSQSEADMALACLLAFWTGGVQSRMDRLFRQSGLMRDKWDAVHYADGSTYGETTIERACSVTTEYYSPSDEQDTPSSSDVDETAGQDSTAPRGGSAVAVPDATEGNSSYAREKARIETIQTLERKLRELEAENERLRTELRAARASDSDHDEESVTGSSRSLIVGRIKSMLRRPF